MSSGLITRWDYQDDIINGGSIAGCSLDVVGQFFTFTLDRVSDGGLIAFLKANPHIPSMQPDCSQGPSIFWVSFTPSGGFAINVARIFP